MIKQNYFLLVLIILVGISSCKQITKATDYITQPTAREIYARNFEDYDIAYAAWSSNFESSKNDSLEITIPFVENIQLHGKNLQVYYASQIYIPA